MSVYQNKKKRLKKAQSILLNLYSEPLTSYQKKQIAHAIELLGDISSRRPRKEILKQKRKFKYFFIQSIEQKGYTLRSLKEIADWYGVTKTDAQILTDLLKKEGYILNLRGWNFDKNKRFYGFIKHDFDPNKITENIKIGRKNEPIQQNGTKKKLNKSSNFKMGKS